MRLICACGRKSAVINGLGLRLLCKGSVSVMRISASLRSFALRFPSPRREAGKLLLSVRASGHLCPSQPCPRQHRRGAGVVTGGQRASGGKKGEKLLSCSTAPYRWSFSRAVGNCWPCVRGRKTTGKGSPGHGFEPAPAHWEQRDVGRSSRRRGRAGGDQSLGSGSAFTGRQRAPELSYSFCTPDSPGGEP